MEWEDINSNVFTININGVGGREKLKSDGRQIQLGELGCLDHLRFKQNTQSRHFFIIVGCGS